MVDINTEIYILCACSEDRDPYNGPSAQLTDCPTFSDINIQATKSSTACTLYP